jgi:hypothetical protein
MGVAVRVYGDGVTGTRAQHNPVEAHLLAILPVLVLVELIRMMVVDLVESGVLNRQFSIFK